MENLRFRFRAWNTKTHELKEVTAVILHPDQHGFSSTVEDKINCNLCYQPHLVLEQCTGLKDKHGRLIYEGDIVRVFYDHFDGNFTEREVVGPVVWECGTWIVKEEEIGWFLNQAPEYDETHWESAAVEVIGNIHDNADLLEGVNEKATI